MLTFDVILIHVISLSPLIFFEFSFFPKDLFHFVDGFDILYRCLFSPYPFLSSSSHRIIHSLRLYLN